MKEQINSVSGDHFEHQIPRAAVVQQPGMRSSHVPKSFVELSANSSSQTQLPFGVACFEAKIRIILFILEKTLLIFPPRPWL